MQTMQTDSPLITTIIPTYRRPQLLQRAILSVLTQTYASLQVCVYDNASGDETAEVVAELAKKDSRVKYFCHHQNIGWFLNFKQGLEKVETSFFSILSDDDVLIPNFYQLALERFNDYPNALFAAGITLIMDANGNISFASTLDLEPRFYEPPEGLYAMLGPNRLHMAVWTGIVFRREVLEKVGNLSSNVGLASDVDFQLRAAANCPFLVFHEPVAIFLSHPLSTSYNTRYTNVWPAWTRIIQNLTEDERISMEAKQYANKMLTSQMKSFLFKLGVKALISRNYEDAIEVARLLKSEFNLNTKSFLLSGFVKLSKEIEVVQKIISHLYAAILKIRNSRNKNIQEIYGHYYKYLNCDL